MKWLFIGLAVVTAGAMVTVYCVAKRKTQNRPHTDAPRSQRTSQEVLSDDAIINSLPQNLKDKIVKCCGALPSKLTFDWMSDDLLACVCEGNNDEIQMFLEALINASNGSLRPAAKVGDMFDMRFMEPDKELPAGYKVKGIVYSGLVRTTTGEVLLKAAVI